MVLETNAVVSEWAMVVHLENAAVANGAMVGPSWFKLVTRGALSIPEALEVCHGFCAVLHQSLDVFLESLEPIIFNFVCFISNVVDSNLSSLSMGSVLDFFSNLFVDLQINWTSWSNDASP